MVKKIIKPKKTLTFAENFFYMCFGKVPQKEIVKAAVVEEGVMAFDK
jgi:citrate synthase